LNSSGNELGKKISDLKNQIEKTHELKHYICSHLVKEKCDECPLIQICENWDQVYTKIIFF